MRKFCLMALLGVALSIGCDKNSTPINESDEPRMEARRHIANVIQSEEADAIEESIVTATDGQTEVSVVSGTAALAEGGGERVIEGIVFTLPETWRETPAQNLSAMRAAEFFIPTNNENERDVEVVVFYFGPGQGGAAEANIQRWIGQVEQSGEPAPQTNTMQSQGLRISTVYLEGTLKPSMMGAGPTEPLPGSALHGAVIEGGPRGALFIKSTGPKEGLKTALPEIESLLNSLRME